MTPVAWTVQKRVPWRPSSLSRSARLPIVTSDPVSITASSATFPAWTSVRISWPRMRRAVTTISPGHGLDRLARILDPHLVRFEVHHQPLLGQRVDPDQPVAADVAFAQRRKLEVGDGARADGEARDLDPIDHVARRRGVEDRRRRHRQLEVMGDAQADDRRVGAAVDDKAIGAAAVDLHVDVEPGADLARLQIAAADRERAVELRRRKGRDVGLRRRRRTRFPDLRGLGRGEHARRGDGGQRQRRGGKCNQTRIENRRSLPPPSLPSLRLTKPERQPAYSNCTCRFDGRRANRPRRGPPSQRMPLLVGSCRARRV